MFGSLDVVGNILGASRNLTGGGGTSLQITTASPLNEMIEGTAFSQTLTASGGTGVYSTWAVLSGALPMGLSLNAGSGAITGTPTTAGTGSVVITVTDSGGNIAGKPLSWEVVDQGFMELEDGSGMFELEDGSGLILLEVG